MNPTTITQTLGCPPGTLPGGLTRTRFFDGMFLTQADLENEQVYWRMKRRLTNRALGTGVVWGLKLTFDLKTQKFRLSPGYALDCCGNDIIVECPVEISYQELYARSAPLVNPQPTNSFTTVNNPNIIVQRRLCVILQYVECPDGIRPVHRDACSPVGSACEPSRVRESCRLLLVPECENITGCEPVNRFTRAIDGLRTSLGSAAAQPRAATWTPDVTYAGGKQTIGALLMAGLQGYLSTADKYHASAQSQLVVSYLLSSVMAGLLDLDVATMTDANRTTLSTAVNELSAALCDGLMYPGPRCYEDHHGIFLGCLVFSLRNNGVEGFSPWLCRREVLLGPLINWWMCQLGSRPIDVIINEWAAKNCEAVSTPPPDDGPILLRANNLTTTVDGQVPDSRTVAPLDFLSTIARAMTTSGDGPGLVRVEATAPNGRPMAMVVPSGAVGGSRTGAVEALANASLTGERSVQPLSRGPLRDLIAELATRTPVSAVVPAAEADAIKPIATMPVSDLLATEPEAILAKLGGARPTDAQRAAVNQLYASAESFVRDATAATFAAGKAGVTRTQLKGAELKAALKKVTGATAAAIDKAADAAASR